MAVALTFLVLIAWQVFFIAPRQKEVKRRQSEMLREKAIEDSLAALAESESRADVPERTTPETQRRRSDAADAADEAGEVTGVAGEIAGGKGDVAGLFRDAGEGIAITITSEKMRVKLRSKGGEIASVKLLEYVRKDGELVELVPEGAKGGFALSLQSGGEWNGFSDVVFDVTVDGRPADGDEEIVLDESKPEAAIMFTREGESGEALTKGYVFRHDGYEVDLSVSIRRDGELRSTEAYSIGWECGMAVTEADVKGDKRQFASLGAVGEEFYKESMGKFGKETSKAHEGMVLWAGSRTKYFLSALITQRQRAGTLAMLGNRADEFIGYSIEYGFRGDPRLTEDTYTCYIGPLDMKTLKAYGIGLEKSIDLGRLRFFSVFILKAMVAMRRFIPNYGVIIIILSILTKVLFYRLTHKSFKSMKDMQRLQPKIKEIQERFKDNKEKMNQETMKLYKEAGVNPLGGCLPLLLQMPVFIALFNVLRNTIELRGAPFALWIDDLSSPDVLFGFGAKLPFLGSEFHLLPILMGAAMVLQTKLGGSPTGQTGPAAQTKMMSTMMPIVFTVIFYGMPSGLVLYWLVNNVFSIIQQYYAHKEIEAEKDGEDGGGVSGGDVMTGEQGGSSEESDKGTGGKKENGKKGKTGGKAGRTRQGKGGRERPRKSKRRSYH
jgi:YidC/Oxa1 family membrane protein insertase